MLLFQRVAGGGGGEVWRGEAEGCPIHPNRVDSFKVVMIRLEWTRIVSAVDNSSNRMSICGRREK